MRIAREVEAGIPIEKVLRARRRIFSPLFTNIFLAGLRSGSLVQSLDELVAHYAWVLEVRAAILRVVWYPIFLLFAGSAIMAAPALVLHFRDNPFNWREAVEIFFFFLRFPLYGMLVAYVMAKVAKSRPVRPVTDEIVMRIPILGKCFARYSLAVFFRMFAASVAAGRELGTGFDAALDAMNNHYLARRLRRAERFLRGGESIAAAFSLTRVIEKQALGMVEAGEISGSLPELLRKMAEYYMTETKSFLPGFIKAFFPLLIIVVAIAYFVHIPFLGYGAFLMFFFLFLTL